jgi:hypothetical protein
MVSYRMLPQDMNNLVSRNIDHHTALNFYHVIQINRHGSQKICHYRVLVHLSRASLMFTLPSASYVLGNDSTQLDSMF